MTNLHKATWENKPEAIGRLLDLGADIEATIGKVEDEKLKKFEGCRAIHIAMMDPSRHSAFTVLLRRGADVFAGKPDGSSPLRDVLSSKNADLYLASIVKRFWGDQTFQRRVEQQFGMTMLHFACYVIVEGPIHQLLREICLDVNARISEDSVLWPGFTPLHVLLSTGLNFEYDISVKSKVHELRDLLLKKGADVTLTNALGDTPVLMSMKTCDRDIGVIGASSLMKYQGDFSVNPADKSGMSHFHVACLLKEHDMVRTFLEHASQTDVNKAISIIDGDKFSGSTPLLLALSDLPKMTFNAQSQVSTVDLLLELGADVRAVDLFGYTALHHLASCAPTRLTLLDKILTTDLDINKRATDGKTPLEILLWDQAPVDQVKYFVDRGARLNAYNPVTRVSYMTIVMNNYQSPNDLLKMMMDSPDIAELSDDGRNAIHNVVTGHNRLRHGSDVYSDVIEKLITLGCNIFQQDSQGETALHLAVKFQNYQAVVALLKRGADVNIVDFAGNSPFSNCFNFDEGQVSPIESLLYTLIRQVFAEHLRMLQIVGLQISQLNDRLLSVAMNEEKTIEFSIVFTLSYFSLVEMIDDNEICARGITLRDFLRQTGAVNMYSSLNQADRDSVDSSFKPACQQKFGLLEGILNLQYRSARERSSLIAPGVEALRELLGFPLPDLCASIILMYLTNLDIKNMTTASFIPDDA